MVIFFLYFLIIINDLVETVKYNRLPKKKKTTNSNETKTRRHYVLLYGECGSAYIVTKENVYTVDTYIIHIFIYNVFPQIFNNVYY